MSFYFDHPSLKILVKTIIKQNRVTTIKQKRVTENK